MSNFHAVSTDSISWVMSYVTESWFVISMAGFGMCSLQLVLTGGREKATGETYQGLPVESPPDA
eukprot:10026596-Ditylum_brightwellii.AAC.2